ncbi:MAG: YeeE/YedE thiosulfate transporter family protein, partial [Sulfuriferula sp.]
MLFESFAQAQSVLLWVTFGLALVLGLMANKTNFCTMGAVSDWVNMGDMGRMRAWLLAIAVAMLGVSVLEYLGMANLDASFPPYRGAQLIWAENILGGLLFGVGMTYASGCGNKTLIRIGGGNIKSIFVLLIIAVIAYFMVNPFPGTDKTLFTVLFNDWLRPLAVNVGAHQDLASFLVGDANLKQARLVLGVLIALLITVFVFKSKDFRTSKDNIIGGLVVGLVVLGAWYISSVVGVKTTDGTVYT